ncbi:MAG: hypothetical protein H6733_00345 [Alphaproteobacteria bacterium]|nr:hypothetical protein [Alphaproteobacteria bacterium]
MPRLLAACGVFGLVGACADVAGVPVWQVTVGAPAVDALVGTEVAVSDAALDDDAGSDAAARKPAGGAADPKSALDTPLEEALGLAIVVEPREIDARIHGGLEVRIATEEGVDLALDEVRRMVASLPEGSLLGVVDEIVLVDGLSDDGVSFRGYATCAAGRMWVRVSAIDTPIGIRHTLFHELTHLLACAAPYDTEAWGALATVPYLGDLRRLDEAMPLTSAAEALQAGFITPYAMTTLHEDVAETVAVRMTRPEMLAQVAASAPVIASKVDEAEAWLQAALPGVRLP